MKVLLIVDVQNDFCPGGSLAVTEGEKIIRVGSALLLINIGTQMVLDVLDLQE
jgi:nicotinamidase-related amidase